MVDFIKRLFRKPTAKELAVSALGDASEGEPFAAEMTALFIIICCVFFVGFYIGRVTA